MTRNEDTQPYGFCQCGCGELAPVAKQTERKRGYVKGEPVRYVVGHSTRGKTKAIPAYHGDGLCQCNCGEVAPIARNTNTARGQIKGHPTRFIVGHSSRTPEAKMALVARSQGRAISEADRRHRSERMTGPRNIKWSGGRSALPRGYVEVWIGRDHPMANSEGYTLEHRLVMSEHIGRSLTTDEVVHHLLESEGGSGRRDDNRIENLRLFENHSAHMRHHAALRRAAATG